MTARYASRSEYGEFSPEARQSSGLISEDEQFVRLTGQQRAQHFLLVVSFSTLVFTGFPLLFPEWPIFESLGGKFQIRDQLHRIAGVGLMIASFWHLAYIMLTQEGSRYFRAMLPKLIDVTQMIEAFLFKLGLMESLYRRGILKEFMDRHPWFRFRNPPDYGRFNWIEKFEYLAVVWGNLVMIVTGLALWFFEAAFALFSKTVMDIFKLVHGFEALLAFLAIIVWHMYNVHISPDVFPMSRIWLDGKISGGELRHHYPAWYREIETERFERGRIEVALREFDTRDDTKA